MRSDSERMFAGVCGGIATYLGVDPVIVRLAFVLLAFASGIGFLTYFLLIVLMPAETSANKSAGEIVQDNLDNLGETINSSVENARAHPQGRTFGAVLLIGMGIYFLLNNAGWISWVPSLLWPIVLIGLGVMILRKRN